MQNNLGLYIPLVYTLAAIPYAWLGLYAWRKRPAAAVTPFAWAMLGMSVWAFMYGLEIFFPTLPAKLLVIKFEYIGIVIIPVFLFIFALEFTGRSNLLLPRVRFLLGIFPAIILLMVWTNEYHHLMWIAQGLIEGNGISLLDAQYGVFFWLHVGFSYTLVFLSGLILVMELLQKPGVYRIHIALVILGISSPVLGNILFVSGSDLIQHLDVTPLFFIPTAIALGWATTRYRLLDILPLEHLTVLQNMKDGVIVVDKQRRILYINPVTEKLFGHLEAHVIGQPLAYLSDVHGEMLASCLDGNEDRSELVFGEQGQVRTFDVSVSSVSSTDAVSSFIGPDSMLVLHDITHRKETELALTRRESIMSAISTAAEQFLREPTWEQNIPSVLKKIGQAADVSRVYVGMNYTGGDGVLYSSMCYEWAAADVAVHINDPSFRHISLKQSGFARWEALLAQGLPIYGLVKEFPEAEAKKFAEQNILSLAAMPIFVDNQWWGYLVFEECRRERYWTGMELEAFRTTADIFGAAEGRARTEQGLLRGQKSLNLLHDIVREALKAQDMKDMAQNAVDRLAELIRADGCFLALWDEASGRTSSLAAYGPYRESYLDIQPPPGKKTLTESALTLGHVLIIEDSHNSPYVDIEVARNFSSHSEMVFPLIASEKKLGSLIFSFDSYHKFQPREIAICDQASSLIALALEKFKAVEQAQRRAITSETLRKASAVVAETLETDQAIPRILEQLKQVVPYDSASVQLLDGNELEIMGGSGFSDHDAVVGMRFPIPGDNPNSVVIETGKPYLLGDVRDVYVEFQKAPNDHIRSWLGVPLKVQGRVIGLLAIDSGEPNDFTQEDTNLAAAFAEQVAVALENTRVFKESQNQAITDALTGLYNRRGLFELGKIEFDRAIQFERPFSAIMIDIDHFKSINDTHSHAVGDKVLQALASRCKKCVREIDVVGRYGGEEIVILLPETDLNLAYIVAERVLDAITSKPMYIASEDISLEVTASLGVASRGDDVTTLEMLLNRADQAMYAAKNNGRNRVFRSL